MTGEGQGCKKQRAMFQELGQFGEEPREKTHKSLINKTRPGHSLEGSVERTSRWGTLNSHTRAAHTPLGCRTKHGSQQHPTLELLDPFWHHSPRADSRVQAGKLDEQPSPLAWATSVLLREAGHPTEASIRLTERGL